MKKIIQIAPVHSGGQDGQSSLIHLFALCEDGKVWVQYQDFGGEGNPLETTWDPVHVNPPVAPEPSALLVTKSASSPEAIDQTDPVGKVGTVLSYAQAGDARRQNQTGKMCYYGDGMPKDKEQAVEWWQKAAAQGNYEAQVSLVNAYRKGEGVEKDQILAQYWEEQAGSQRTDEVAQ